MQKATLQEEFVLIDNKKYPIYRVSVVKQVGLLLPPQYPSNQMEILFQRIFDYLK